jgi:ubiquinone/menaquinone biosynthesis C-methylase UbiE
MREGLRRGNNMTENYIEVWDRIAPKFANAKVGKTCPEQEKVLLEELERSTSVLDVGCANGKHVFFLARQGFTATGVDLSKQMIKIAERGLETEKLKANFLVGDATNLEFPDKSFDYVISMGNTIGSIPGAKSRSGPRPRLRALKEMIRIARKKIILELVKSDTTEETKARYRFSDETYVVKRWDEKEISNISNELGYEPDIKRGRGALIADYFFYAIINLEGGYR